MIYATHRHPTHKGFPSPPQPHYERMAIIDWDQDLQELYSIRAWSLLSPSR
jgi:hypothetical protein